MVNSFKKILLVNLALDFFILESLIKYYILNKVPTVGFYLLGKFLKIIYTPNQNIAFSLPLPQITIIVMVIIILIISSYIWWQSLIKGNLTEIAAISLVIFGALSNLLDRLLFGYVIDYISISIWPSKAIAWPVFNLADVMIVGGVLIFIINRIKK